MVEKLLQPLLYIIRHQKKYILLTLISALVFAVLCFPYDDLSDLITEQIAKRSQNVFISFNELGVSFFPPSLKMSNVTVDTDFVPTVKAERLYLAPAYSALLAFNPGFTTVIEGFMNGAVHLTYATGKKINDQIRMQNVDLDISKMDLKSLTKFATLPIDADGAVNMDLSTEFDPTFTEQPNGEYKLVINDMNLASFMVFMSPVPIGFKFNKIVLKGTMKNSQFIIEEGQIGSENDPLHGTISGNVGVRMIRMGNRVVPQWSNYEFSVDLNLDRTAEQKLSSVMGIINIDKYKTVTGSGSRYSLNLSGPSFQAFPTLAPYSKK